jgi:hypothetical protein
LEFGLDAAGFDDELADLDAPGSGWTRGRTASPAWPNSANT